MGFDIQSEVLSSYGRIDMIITIQYRIFIFEFKFDGSSKEALEQIMKRRYYEKYLNKGKDITLVGISFNYKNKKLVLDWTAEKYATNRFKE
jgi:hypothetical protein